MEINCKNALKTKKLLTERTRGHGYGLNPQSQHGPELLKTKDYVQPKTIPFNKSMLRLLDTTKGNTEIHSKVSSTLGKPFYAIEEPRGLHILHGGSCLLSPLNPNCV